LALTGVAVEKVHFSQNSRNLGDRKCLGNPRKSFVLDTLGASALKERIGRPGQMSASSAHVPRLRLILADHHLEIAAFDAIRTAHHIDSPLAGCF
jgi:hypothetical protein